MLMSKSGVIISSISPYKILEIRGEREKRMEKTQKHRIGYYACQ